MTRDEMDRLTEAADTLSEKIRILDRAGVPKADIARHVGRRYQHIYNVLKPVSERAAAPTSRRPAAQTASGVSIADVRKLTIETDGIVRLPGEWLGAQGLEAGDALFCRVEVEELTLMSRSAAVDALRAIARDAMPGQAALLEALLGPDAEPRS